MWWLGGVGKSQQVLHISQDELVMDRLDMTDKTEGFLFRIGRWSEAYMIRLFPSQR